MGRALLFLVGCLVAVGCTTQRMICPAYQSAFIYDPVALRKHFSYFENDSTPKMYTVSRDRYLLLPKQSYRKKIRSMQTVEMKPVYTQIPDSLQEKKDDQFAGAEQDSSDSTTVSDSTATAKNGEDSTYAITKDKEVRVLKYDPDSLKFHIVNITFNAEQDNYMWYFRDVLVLPDVRAALEEEKNGKNKTDENGDSKTGKKKRGFFDLFKKHPKDTTHIAQTSSDSTTVTPPQKKGFNPFRKKKQGDQPVVKPKEPAKKEDDGF
jgi:hypothetical protein